MISDEPTGNPDATILSEVQLLLSEKRTAMSAMRTGIAKFALPRSVLSVLVATSKFYDRLHVLPLLAFLATFNLGLMALAIYLIIRAMRRLHHYDRLICLFCQHDRAPSLREHGKQNEMANG